MLAKTTWGGATCGVFVFCHIYTIAQKLDESSASVNADFSHIKYNEYFKFDHDSTSKLCKDFELLINWLTETFPYQLLDDTDDSCILLVWDNPNNKLHGGRRQDEE